MRRPLLIAGADLTEQIEIEPIVEAFVVLIVVSLIGAAIVQAVARGYELGRRI